MAYTVRPATRDDHADIASFTRDTFDWGDYVADSFPKWLEDPGLHIVVAEAPSGAAVGVMKATMVGPGQVWLAAARVHPHHRGQGLGSMLNDAGVDWGRTQGAVVARLLIEEWNEAPQHQVTKLGYRRAGGWAFARRTLDRGGKRLPADERLMPASAEDASDAWVAWNAGPLSSAARGLLIGNWICRKMTHDDLVEARQRSALWSCPAGWVMAEVIEGGASLGVNWLQAAPGDYERLIGACEDYAAGHALTNLLIWTPTEPSLVDALTSRAYETSLLSVWEKPL